MTRAMLGAAHAALLTIVVWFIHTVLTAADRPDGPIRYGLRLLLSGADNGDVQLTTIEEIRTRQGEIHTEMRGLADAAGDEEFTEEQQTRWDELDEEYRTNTDRITHLERRRARLDEMAANAAHERGTGTPDPTPGPTTGPGGQPVRGPGDPYDLRSLSFTSSPADLRARAITAIEQTRGLTDRNRQAATALLERHDTPQGHLARHLLATGAPAYRSGFQKLIAGAQAEMTETERTAITAARAMSLTDAAGGYAVPFTLDPTIIDTRDGSTNPFRRISTIRTTVTDQWQGVTSGGMTVSWDGEAAEVSDDSPSFGPAPIPVHKAQGFGMGSIEITQDYAALEADLREMVRNAKDDAEAAVFATGSGNDQPTGFVTAVAAAGAPYVVTPTTAETFAVADLYKMEQALPPRYRLSAMDGDVSSSRASWLGARSIFNLIRQFGTADSHALWARLGAGLPEQLIGYPTYEASTMDGSFDAAATANNYILALGDFRGFVIVDRVGLSVEYIPHVFGANGRPTGQRGWYAYWRVGSDVVNDNAIRLLNIATTA